MKVFVSSVTHRLKDERNALPDLLKLMDHDPLRFEDFLAQDRSGRQACLAGVDAAEVYVLLLGSKYGDPFPDTGLSPTAEEFHRARQRGIPVLVFNKVLEEDDEPRQAEFKAEVGHYVNGRFWRSFTDPLSCNKAVGEALKELQVDAGPVRRETPPGPVDVPWLGDVNPGGASPGAGGGFGYGSRGAGLVPGSVYAPVLELHLVPVGSPAQLSSRELGAVASRMARDARSAGFFSESDQLHIDAGGGHAWALRPPGSTSSATGSASWLHGRSTERFRGLVATQAGAVGAFTSLVTDTLGALVNQASLQLELATLFGLVHPHLPDLPDDAAVSLAAGLVNADRAWEGDPADVGGRTSGSLRTNQGASIRVGGDFVVPAARLTRWFGDLGADLAHDIAADLNHLQ